MRATLTASARLSAYAVEAHERALSIDVPTMGADRMFAKVFAELQDDIVATEEG